MIYLWMFSISWKLVPLSWIFLTDPGASLLMSLQRTTPSFRQSSQAALGRGSPRTALIQFSTSCSCSLFLGWKIEQLLLLRTHQISIGNVQKITEMNAINMQQNCSVITNEAHKFCKKNRNLQVPNASRKTFAPVPSRLMANERIPASPPKIASFTKQISVIPY